jgi:hypothetical protein
MAEAQTVLRPKPGWAYPVHVRVDPHPAASRWLWVVKWLLLVPHVVVLVFLWLAFLVLSIVALVAIELTGHYPRSIFDFNVGVLRWTWRVEYYGYGVLATDRYPPFTLQDVPDYPAHLDVTYPEHLSRGLALVKWWLLALPQYVVVSVLVGTGTWLVMTWDERWRLVWGGGLVGILVLVAAAALLLTGRYPGSVHDLLVGLHRWVLRVSAYAALMTDEYPPFRLDQGPDEPAPAGVGAPPSPPATQDDVARRAPPVQPGGTQWHAAPGGWTAGRVVSVVAGSFAVVVSLGALIGGMGLLVANHTARDDGGFLTTVERPVNSTGYAVAVSARLSGAGPADTSVPQRLLGQVRLRVTPTLGDHAVFVGIGPTQQVDAYLSGVAHSRYGTDLQARSEVPGGPAATPPADATFWSVSATGTGPQQLVWTPRTGSWTVVLMNADGSTGVSATADVGATFPWLGAAGGAVVALGVLLLFTGATALTVALLRVRGHETAT